MTSSAAYSFNPAFSEVVLSAYARVGLRSPALTAQHFWDAGQEGNYLLSSWASLQPLLWKSELIEQVLTQGTETYELPGRVVMILLTYIETGSGQDAVNRVLGPLSTVEYASVPNKNMQAPPSSYWFNRQITPEITFWQSPDGNGPYTAKMRVVTQVQDIAIPGGETADLPYRALDAFVAGLSHRLARIHAPALEQARKADAMEAWQAFSGNDIENVNMIIAPAIGSYYPV